MKRSLLVLVLLLAFPGSALAKGPVNATIRGPGPKHPILVPGKESVESSPLYHLCGDPQKRPPEGVDEAEVALAVREGSRRLLAGVQPGRVVPREPRDREGGRQRDGRDLVDGRARGTARGHAAAARPHREDEALYVL